MSSVHPDKASEKLGDKIMTIKQQALWHVIRIAAIIITVAVMLTVSLHLVGIILTAVLIMTLMLGYCLRVVYHMELRRLQAEEKEQARGR